jgi:NAD(P)-dependent dehydrogenase (short-subunit alcohol dehydrogenase family)
MSGSGDNSVPDMGSPNVAVVTGAARGIGKAIADRFAHEGYAVRGLDVEGGEGSQALQAGKVTLARCDVSVEEEVAAAISSVETEAGAIDVLVNVAGVIVVGPVEELSYADFRRMVEVNLGGQWLTVKYAVGKMKQRRAGVIVNIASVSGHVGQVDHAVYGATKGAVIAFTRALALELAPFGVRAVSISPGSVDTEMLRSDLRTEAARLGRSFEELRAERENEQALRRWADPSEIAGLALFLASSEAGFITGADVLIDGGWTAR